MSSKVDSILSLAKALRGDELVDLIGRLKQQEREARSLTFAHGTATYHLARASDEERFATMSHALPIMFDELSVWLHGLGKGTDVLSLAELYAALVQLSGESSRFVDKDRRAFAFPFFLDVVRPEGTFPYLFEVLGYKSTFEFALHRLVPKDDPRARNRCEVKPFENELPEREIQGLIVGFHKALRGLWKVGRESWNAPFLIKVPSGNVVFGYLNGRFFEHGFESCDDYDRFVARAEKLAKAQSAREGPSGASAPRKAARPRFHRESSPPAS